MNYVKPPSQNAPIPAEGTFGNQDLLASNTGTDDDLYRYMDTLQPTAQAPGIVTADPGCIVTMDGYEYFQTNTTGSSHGHVQGLQTPLDSLLPEGGAPYPMVAQSNFLPCPTVEMANGAPPAPGSLPWYKDISGQTHSSCHFGLAAMNDYGLQEQPDIPFGWPARSTLYQNGSRDSAPWGIPFLHETGGPIGAIPMSSPTYWHMETLVHLPSHDVTTFTKESPVASPVPVPVPDKSRNGERNPTDSPSHPSWRPRQFAWDATTGEDVPIKTKKCPDEAQRSNSRAVRARGGQCPKCKKDKRRCDPAHPRGSSEASTTSSSPPGTPSSLAFSWIMVSLPKHQSTKIGDRLLPPAQSRRSSEIHGTTPFSADAELRLGPAVAPDGHERPVPLAPSADSGNRTTDMLSQNALEGKADDTMEWSGEAGSSVPNPNHWGDSPFSQAYLGLGGQFGSAG